MRDAVTCNTTQNQRLRDCHITKRIFVYIKRAASRHCQLQLRYSIVRVIDDIKINPDAVAARWQGLGARHHFKIPSLLRSYLRRSFLRLAVGGHQCGMSRINNQVKVASNRCRKVYACYVKRLFRHRRSTARLTRSKERHCTPCTNQQTVSFTFAQMSGHYRETPDAKGWRAYLTADCAPQDRAAHRQFVGRQDPLNGRSEQTF